MVTIFITFGGAAAWPGLRPADKLKHVLLFLQPRGLTAAMAAVRSELSRREDKLV